MEDPYNSKEHRWASELDWVREKFMPPNERLYSALVMMAARAGSEGILDVFRTEMEVDGFFDKIKEEEK